jgi:hypothetical protein
MRTRQLFVAASELTLSLATLKPAQASIHEIIGALCRTGGAEREVEPPGQNKPNLNSFLRALQATGFIVSIDTSDPSEIVITFDTTVPNAKYKSAGFDLVLPDFGGPGVSLRLSPLPIPDEDFPAHANCHNLK